MLHEHHKQIINNIKLHFIHDPNVLAFITNGSVARGSAGPESDIDFILVVSDDEYKTRERNSDIQFNINSFCIPPCIEANGSAKTVNMLKWLINNGSDVSRYAFVGSNVIFSKVPNLDTLLKQITTFPSANIENRLECFYSQVKMHYSYLEYGHYSKNIYVLYQTAILITLFGGRMILTHNKMFYPGRKWFLNQLEEAKKKPKDFIYFMKKLIQNPCLTTATEFYDLLLNFRDWPQPSEGWFNRYEQDMKDRRWNTID
ncbi:MAG: nucleotidyltransferase domain-containing protein [Promethearchaeota archaeon]